MHQVHNKVTVSVESTRYAAFQSLPYGQDCRTPDVCMRTKVIDNIRYIDRVLSVVVPKGVIMITN